MIFFKNIEAFLDEIRHYDRQFFTPYQWRYIQRYLEEHQSVLYILSRYSSGFFDKVYDDSVLHYETASAQVHNIRYNTKKNRVLSVIKSLVEQEELNNPELRIDAEKLSAGYYREYMLHFPQVAASALLIKYVNFLFDYFENQKEINPICSLMIGLSLTSETVLSKEPLFAALEDSRRAYEEEPSQALYQDLTYSCLDGLSQRLYQFYSYLEPAQPEGAVLTLEEQYVEASIAPFVDLCPDSGLKPSALLYSMYLYARYGTYEMVVAEVSDHHLFLSADDYASARNQYVSAQKRLIFHSFQKECPHEPIIVYRQDYSKAHVRPWMYLFSKPFQKHRSIELSDEYISLLLAEYFDEHCQQYLKKSMLKDCDWGKIKSFQLQEFVTSSITQSCCLVVPQDDRLSHERALQQFQHLFSFSLDWFDVLCALPGAQLFEKLESWADARKSDAFPLEVLHQKLSDCCVTIEHLQHALFDKSVELSRQHTLAVTDYYILSPVFLDFIHSKILEQPEIATMIEQGFLICGQDRLMLSLLQSWQKSDQTSFCIRSDRGEIHLNILGSERLLSMLVVLGYEQTLNFLLPLYSKNFLNSRCFYADDYAPDCLMFHELLALSSCSQAAAQYFSFNNHCDLYQSSYIHGVQAQNIDYLKSLTHAFSKKDLAKVPGYSPKFYKKLLHLVVKQRDKGLWQLMEPLLKKYSDFFQNQNTYFTTASSEIRLQEIHPLVASIILFNDLTKIEIRRFLKLLPPNPHISLGVMLKDLHAEREPLSYCLRHKHEYAQFLLECPSYRDYLFHKTYFILSYLEHFIKSEDILALELLFKFAISQLHVLDREKKSIKLVFFEKFNQMIADYAYLCLENGSVSEETQLHSRLKSMLILLSQAPGLPRKLNWLTYYLFSKKNNSGVYAAAIDVAKEIEPDWLLETLNDCIDGLLSPYQQPISKIQGSLFLLEHYYPEKLAQHLEQIITSAHHDCMLQILCSYYRTNKALFHQALHFAQSYHIPLSLEESFAAQYLQSESLEQMTEVLECLPYFCDVSTALQHLLFKRWLASDSKSPQMLDIQIFSLLYEADDQMMKDMVCKIWSVDRSDEIHFANTLVAYCAHAHSFALVLQLKIHQKSLYLRDGYALLPESVLAHQFEFASMLLKKYPNLAHLETDSYGRTFRCLSLSTDLAVIHWLLLQKAYEPHWSRSIESCLRESLHNKHLEKSQLLITIGVERAWFSKKVQHYLQEHRTFSFDVGDDGVIAGLLSLMKAPKSSSAVIFSGKLKTRHNPSFSGNFSKKM